MKPIYEELLERVANGEKFHIDFEKRNMRVGRQYLIKNGEYDRERKLINSSEENISMIEKLYQEYRVSCPSERSENKHRKYFKALSVDELSDIELATGEPREIAQSKLEGYILCSVLNGTFKWDENIMGSGWFWQSNINRDLIILRKWIEFDNTKLI